mmetsp:Transcript_3497/g.8388  ORF Transcript_3497/g.8388 Transcript_3497/m.8388 type:complete len:220 (+) Transcript_3497:930-1589(+)
MHHRHGPGQTSTDSPRELPFQLRLHHLALQGRSLAGAEAPAEAHPPLPFCDQHQEQASWKIACPASSSGTGIGLPRRTQALQRCRKALQMRIPRSQSQTLQGQQLECLMRAESPSSTAICSVENTKNTCSCSLHNLSAADEACSQSFPDSTTCASPQLAMPMGGWLQQGSSCTGRRMHRQFRKSIASCWDCAAGSPSGRPPSADSCCLQQAVVHLLAPP